MIEVDEDMSINDARDIAEDHAKINAIESAFGTYTGRETDIYIKDGHVDFDIIMQTKVRDSNRRPALGWTELGEANPSGFTNGNSRRKVAIFVCN